MTPSTTRLALLQGEVGTSTVTVTRNNYRVPVHLSVSGLPDGATATFTPALLSADQSKSELSVSVPINALSSAGTLHVHVTGEGVRAQSAELALTIGVRGEFTLRVVPGTLVVAQGGGDVASPGARGHPKKPNARWCPRGLETAVEKPHA